MTVRGPARVTVTLAAGTSMSGNRTRQGPGAPGLRQSRLGTQATITDSVTQSVTRTRDSESESRADS